MPSQKEITLILHGWSDSSSSFQSLKQFLVKNDIGEVQTIFYGDYESREDNLTFNDIADGLNDQFLQHGFIDKNGNPLCRLKVIVHSTGGLVIRHWIWRYYAKDGLRVEDCPIRKLVMLAPANFGSPLAHRGKSFFGALLKGRWELGNFLEVGRQILDGLELASPYQWELAHDDLFLPKSYYRADAIQTTILVGVDDYDGLSGWVNKIGTDGVVVISGTPLNSVKLTLDFSKPPANLYQYTPFEWTVSKSVGDIAFGVLEGLNHSTIVSKFDNDPGQLGDLVLRALKAKSGLEFKSLKSDLTSITEKTYAGSGKSQYQQILLHAVDDQDAPVYDFTLEFYIARVSKKLDDSLVKMSGFSKEELYWSDQIQAAMSIEFHTNTKDPSFRRMLFDVAQVQSILRDAKAALGTDVVLSMRMHVPDIDQGIRYDTRTLQNVILYDTSQSKNGGTSFLYPNTTTLVELRVDRYTTYVRVGVTAEKH